MSKQLTDFKVHVHRQALHSADPKKWYAHIGTWGADPRAFVDIEMNVPTTCVVNLESGCGCAQAWIAGHVPTDEVTWSDDFNTLYLGKKKK